MTARHKFCHPRSQFLSFQPWLLRVLHAIIMLSTMSGCALIDGLYTRAVRPPSFDGQQRLTDDIEPLHYTIKLNLDTAKNTFDGEAIITMRLKQKMRWLTLHGGDLAISYVGVENHAESFVAEAISGPNGGLLINFGRSVPPGETVVKIRYSSQLKKRQPGLQRHLYGERAFIITANGRRSARSFFPCFDEPRFKIPVKLYVTAPITQSVFTNTLEVERKVEDEKQILQFAESKPIGTSMVSVAVGQFEATKQVSSADAPSVRLFTHEGKAALGEAAERRLRPVINALSDYFNEQIPNKLDVIAIHGLNANFISAPGLLLVEEPLILRVPEDTSPLRQAWLEQHLIEAASKQWLGHFVSSETLSDEWFYHGLGQWLSTHHRLTNTNTLVRRPSQSDLISHLVRLELLHEPASLKPDAVTGHNINPSRLGLARGRLLFTMLERQVGVDTFHMGLRQIVERHRFEAPSLDALWASLRSDAKTAESEPLKWYIKQPGVPFLRLKTACQENQLKVSVRQERARLTNSTHGQGNPWSIPLCLKLVTNSSAEVHCRSVTTRDARYTVPVKACPTFIHANDGMSGLYEWHANNQYPSLSPAQLKQLTRVEKASLPNHLLNLLLMGELSPASYSAGLSAIWKAGDEPARIAVLESLDAIRRAAHAQQVTAPFERWVENLIGGKQAFAFNPETPLSRLDLAKLVLLSSPPLNPPEGKLRQAYIKAASAIGEYGLSRHLHLLARDGGAQFHRALLDALKVHKNDAVMQLAIGAALGAFRSQPLLKQTLSAARSGELPIRSISALAGAVQPTHTKTMWNWLLEHQDALEHLEAGLSTHLMVGLSHKLCDRKTQSQLNILKTSHASGNPSAIADIERAANGLKSCLATRKHLGIAFFPWLNQKTNE